MEKIKTFINNILSKIRVVNNAPLPVKAAFWYTISAILQKGVAFITTPIFTRLLTKEQYGVYALYNSWLGILTIFVTLNLSYGVYINGMSKYEDEKDKFTSSLQSLVLFIFVVMLLIYVMFRNFFNSLFDLSTEYLIVMLTQIAMVSGISFWTTKKRFEYSYKPIIFLSILLSIVGPLISVLSIEMIRSNEKVLILSYAFFQILIGLILVVINLWKGKVYFNKTFWFFALSFNIPLIPHYLSQILLEQLDRVMINNYFGTSSVAMYNIAYSIGMLCTIIVTSINNSLVPWIYHSLKKGEDSKISNRVEYLVILIALFSLITVIVAPELVAIMAPKSYQYAVWVVPPVAISIFLKFVYGIFSNIEFYYEKTKIAMLASILACLSNVFLNLLFLPVFGFIAAGYTTMISYLLCTFVHYLFLKKMNKEKIYNAKQILLVFIILIVLSAIIQLFYPYPFLRYGIVIVLLSIIWFKKKIIIDAIKSK